MSQLAPQLVHAQLVPVLVVTVQVSAGQEDRGQAPEGDVPAVAIGLGGLGRQQGAQVEVLEEALDRAVAVARAVPAGVVAFVRRVPGELDLGVEQRGQELERALADIDPVAPDPAAVILEDPPGVKAIEAPGELEGPAVAHAGVLVGHGELRLRMKPPAQEHGLLDREDDLEVQLDREELGELAARARAEGDGVVRQRLDEQREQDREDADEVAGHGRRIAGIEGP